MMNSKANVPSDSTERIHLSVADARALSERAVCGMGFNAEEARIITDHVLDAALCGYEYSGLPKILNVVEHKQLRIANGVEAIVIRHAVARVECRPKVIQEIRNDREQNA